MYLTQIIWGVLWLLLIGAGIYVLSLHAYSPCATANPNPCWPVRSKIKPTPNKATLVMFAHPLCPCTPASIDELAELMARENKRLNAYVLFVNPRTTNNTWVKSSLYSRASAIPMVMVLADNDGEEAHLFHALTSGQTIVYDKSGKLIFSGGITKARGHLGDNPSLRAIPMLLNKTTTAGGYFPVFGCPLFEPALK